MRYTKQWKITTAYILIGIILTYTKSLFLIFPGVLLILYGLLTPVINWLCDQSIWLFFKILVSTFGGGLLGGLVGIIVNMILFDLSNPNNQSWEGIGYAFVTILGGSILMGSLMAVIRTVLKERKN